jgi:hypothetical protein
MSYTLVRDAADRARNLTPFATGPYPLIGLHGTYAAVCSSLATTPEELRELQAERTKAYMSTRGPESRTTPGHAPRYYVTSSGKVIAWVALDGTTHYPEVTGPMRLRHQAMIRAAWPEKFSTEITHRNT